MTWRSQRVHVLRLAPTCHSPSNVCSTSHAVADYPQLTTCRVFVHILCLQIRQLSTNINGIGGEVGGGLLAGKGRGLCCRVGQAA